VVPATAAQCLGLANPVDAANTCVVVISHDCDIANDNLLAEPCVEVIVGRVVAKIEGNFAWGKAPRVLHYAAMRGLESVGIEVATSEKRCIKKMELAGFEPDRSFQIDGKILATLRSWLGSRYNRASFPDAFVKRMQSAKADIKLAKALESSGDLISFVYFDVDGGANIERLDGDPYQLNIVLVFPPGADAEESADDAEKLAGEVEQAVGARLSGGKAIALRSCFAVSEDDLPVSKAKVLTQWRLEHMTLKSDNTQPGPPAL